MCVLNAPMWQHAILDQWVTACLGLCSIFALVCTPGGSSTISPACAVGARCLSRVTVSISMPKYSRHDLGPVLNGIQASQNWLPSKCSYVILALAIEAVIKVMVYISWLILRQIGNCLHFPQRILSLNVKEETTYYCFHNTFKLKPFYHSFDPDITYVK